MGGKGSKHGLSEKESKKVSVLLHSVPVLSKLSTEERASLSGLLKQSKYKKGKVIFKQGDAGDAFYIIRDGEVKVTVNGEDVAALKGGDYFGEAALLVPGTKRNATITAVSAVSCYVLTGDEFTKLFAQKKSKVKFVKRVAVAADQRERKVIKPAGASTEKNEGTTNFILKSVQNNILFNGLEREQQEGIIKEMYKTTFKKGDSPIKQGDLGDNFYVVESGKFVIIKDGKQVPNFEQTPGTCFGELALMYNAPRAATVTASEDSVVWTVDRYTFRRVVSDTSKKQFEAYASFLAKVDLLSSLAGYEREKVAEALEEVTVKKGDVIIKQGDTGDAMYIVWKGECVVTKDGAEVARCKDGDYFGERALLKDEPRAATVVASDKQDECVLLKLDRTSFTLLLGPLEELMKRTAEEKYDAGKSSATATATPTEASESGAGKGGVKKGFGDIKFDDLDLIGTLGKGAFGHVQLVKHKQTKHTYAMKTVSKQLIVETGQQGHILSEKRTMAELTGHPFIVELAGTFKDSQRLFFLLEPCLGGDLFSVLRDRTLFDDAASRLYSACVVCAFEHMHSLNIVYRDLKPENLLLDSGGYLKVTDFGFAKDISAGRTWTLCGTPDYLAPEIVSGKGHGKGVDWWTVGVFIYEMLASYAPFYDEDPMKTYQKIVKGQITFPSHFNKESISLITKLLQNKASRRLGVTKGGASLIKKHPWYKGFDWDKLMKRELETPFVPVIKSDVDMSNIEEYEEGVVEPFPPEVEKYEDDGTDWDAEF